MLICTKSQPQQPLCISNTAHHELSFLYHADLVHSCGTDAPSQSPKAGQASRCCSTLVLLTGKLKSGSTTFTWVPTLVGESSHQHMPVLLILAIWLCSAHLVHHVHHALFFS